MSPPTADPPTTWFIDSPCPYLLGRTFRQEMFLSDGMDGRTWDSLLSRGWRHFGCVFFRPQCRGCRACTPLRVLAAELQPTRSQRRVLRKNAATRVEFAEGPPGKAEFEVYADHTRFKFPDREPDFHDFMESFDTSITPSLISRYHVGETLAAVGFLDVTPEAFSSIYFVYREAFHRLSLGTFSVFAECQEAARRGLKYYYLGYWIAANQHMSYKADFGPHEIMDWDSGKWSRVEGNVRAPTP